jgi:hypothetical protein
MTQTTKTFFDVNHQVDSPYHYNFLFKKTTQQWNGMDTEELYNQHLKDAKSVRLLKKLGWDSNSISYKFNSLGFRCDEFDDRACGLAIGCSFTQGVGLPLSATWPSLLSELTNTHVWNLGSGGASSETVFRIFEYSVKKLSPKFVCILLPPPGRFEFHDSSNGYPIILPSDLGQHPSFAKDWLSQIDNGVENQKKIVLAIERICELMKIPLVVNHSQSNLGIGHRSLEDMDLARDLAHSGVKYQRYHAEFMFNELSKLNILNSNDCTKE